jgi:hypothetical protein
MTLADGPGVPVWGFSFSASGPVGIPGPALIVDEGDTVTIELHNALPGERISLSIPGQSFLPNTLGVIAPNTLVSTFVASQPGTYAYEAGLTANGPAQVAMGLFGAFIVRPTANPSWAYDDPATAFTDEALLVFSEVDPAFSFSPDTPDLNIFKPKYWLLNGSSYSQTVPISVAPGSTLLLRYLNAGLQEHSIGILGRHQTVIGQDNQQLPFSYRVVAETIGAGQALDVLVTIPPTVTVGTRYPIYNTGLQQNHNGGTLAGNNTVAYGGILTFVEVTGGVAAADTGPLASGVTITPDVANATTDVTLAATLDETNTGGELVVAAEYFTDTVGAPGTGLAMAVTPGVTVSVSELISGATLANWETGDVTFYVRGQDADGTWGPLSSTVLDLINVGPVVRGLYIAPSPTNGSRPVLLRATGDGAVSGGLNVTATEYFIDDNTGAPGTGIAMALNRVAPIVEATATIPQPVVDALAEGEHVVYVRAMDALNNWGGFSTISLWVDKTGPPSAGTSLVPNPNSGRIALNASSNSIRMMGEAGILSEISVVERAEGFIDAVGANGAGFPLVAYDALYNNLTEIVYVDIPLPTIQLLSEGPHPISFHSKDVAGNWGSYDSLTLVIDKTGPGNVSGSVTPNPAVGAVTVELLAGYVDTGATNPNGTAPGSTIVAAEWFVGVDPGAGFANPMVADDGSFNSNTETAQALINVTSWVPGTYQLRVRAKDIAGNWSGLTTINLTRTAPAVTNLLLDGFESGDLGSWSSVVGSMEVAGAASLDAGSYGLRAVIDGSAPAYVVDQSPNAEKDYRAGFLFNPHWSYNGGNDQDIFVGRDGQGNAIFGLQYRDGYSAEGAGVRAWALAGGEKVYTAWAALKTNARQSLSLSWRSDAAGTLFFMVDGKAVQALTGLDTSASVLEEVWLGPSGGLSEQAFGTQFFDGFESQRNDAPLLLFKLFVPSVQQ